MTWRPKGVLTRSLLDWEIKEAQEQGFIERDQLLKGLWWLRMEGLQRLRADIKPYARKKARG